MTKRYAIAASAAMAAILSGSVYFAFVDGAEVSFVECRATKAVAGESSIGGPFALVDKVGRTVSDRDVFEKPSLLYFGYTYCPDICPLDVLRNAEAADALTAKGYDVTPVFVTVDPERDTPEVVGDFASNMHPNMIGLTGSLDQVKDAADAYKVFFKRHESEDEFYLVDHTTFTYLVLPEHGFVEFFRRRETPEELALRTSCFIDSASRIG
ncbi:MAG: SCO family protein [Albidovulum sp.]|nr:SCO family protein [Albidovulum sp.]